MRKNLKGIHVDSYWTKGRKAAKLLDWSIRHALIRGADGRVHFEQKNIEAPSQWSQLAVEIAASRYFRKAVPKQSGVRLQERSIKKLVDRVVDAIVLAGVRQGVLNNPQDRKNFSEELKYLLWTQRAAFNSPVWFNVGLWESYKMISKSEHFAWNSRQKKVTSVQNAYERPQASACFIQSVNDSIEGIFDLARAEAKLFKYGSGSGSNFSTLRSRFEEIQTGGTSSGLISFLEVLDRGAGAIKSGGTTRRAAKMVIVDVDHPEIFDFIDWKMNEEKKAQALVKAGWGGGFEGPAYHTVAGQNANNSVRVTDQFMKTVEKGGLWSLRRRDGRLFKKVPAVEIWNQISQAAWFCADPGLQFHDRINLWHTCPEAGPIRASNPCSEYMFLDESACNLGSLNLAHFFDEHGEFLHADFQHAVRLMMIAQEILVDHASYPTQSIAEKSHAFRPLGLGFANLGSVFMRMGLSYADKRSRAWASYLSALMTGEAYRTSVELAALRGPFSGYEKNKKEMLKVLRRHQKEVNNFLRKNRTDKTVSKPLSQLLRDVWDQTLGGAKKFGIRNAQVTVIAPTGTIGLLMDCDTTGIEPEFSLQKRKKLAGGGEIIMVNQSVKLSLKKLGYGAEQIQSIEKKIIAGARWQQEVRLEHWPVFSCASGPMALQADDHLQMMAAVQPFLSGAISKTVNLPETATVQDIADTYMRAWKLGLKSIAIYRDGSKGGQPLSAEKSAQNPFMVCPDCGAGTELHGGCYQCVQCGLSLGCA